MDKIEDQSGEGKKGKFDAFSTAHNSEKCVVASLKCHNVCA